MNYSENRTTIAFLTNEKVRYPPNIQNIKVYYLSKELVRRGICVKWIIIGNGPQRKSQDQIDFISMNSSRNRVRTIRTINEIMRVAKLCKHENVGCVYADEWLLYREDPVQRFLLQLLLRAFRIRFVIDQRDPYLDFKITLGFLHRGSIKYAFLAALYRATFLLADLTILPSKEYARVYQMEGIPEKKVFGTFRGIDTQLFNPNIDVGDLRKNLEANGKFVIGWFGIMLGYRQISEILIPISMKIRKLIPNALLILGGEGPEESKINKLIAEEPDLPIKFVRFVPYEKLPKYLSSCNVLLCPVDTRFRFTRSGIWLKLFEAIAVGRPVVATRTPLSNRELKDLAGIVWVRGTLESFLDALKTIHDNYQPHLQAAMQQARMLSLYDTKSTFKEIANRILERIST